MSKPTRIQRKRVKGWRMPEGAVYVGRPTRWGNPWRLDRLSAHEYVIINPDGTETIDSWGGRNFSAQWVVNQYALHVGPMGNYEIELDDLEALRGRDLACWCPLDQPCHADVLLEIANAETDEPRRTEPDHAYLPDDEDDVSPSTDEHGLVHTAGQWPARGGLS